MVGGLKIIMKGIMKFELALLKAYIILFTYLRMHDWRIISVYRAK